MIGRWTRLAAVGLLGAGVAQGASPMPGLSPDSPLAGQLNAGESLVVPLAAGEGDFLRGSLDSGPVPLDLEVVDGEGKPFRSLLRASTGRGDFVFVAPGAGPSLRLTAGERGGAFALALDRRIPPAGQVADPEPPLSPTIAGLVDDLAAGRSLDAFWARIAERGTPLVEDGPDGSVVLTFLVRGAKRSVRLFGAPVADHVALERLGESDLWYASFVVPEGTRLSYKIAPDVPVFPGSAMERRRAILATAQADPLNHHPWPADAPDVFNRSSTVELPGAPPQPWVAERGAPAGSVTRHRFESAALGNGRDVFLYRSPGYDPKDPRTILLVLFDADHYLTKAPTPRILDNMVADGVLPPLAAVLVANPDAEARSRELPGNPAFAAMMARDLVPWAARDLGLTLDPARTVLAGSSYGGLASATIALAYPEVFGNVLSMSGSFWWHPPGTPEDRSVFVADRVIGMETKPVRFFMSAGLFEGARPGALGAILETNRHVRDVLRAKGYTVRYREYAAGHDYLAWRGILSDGLLALFGS